MLKVTNNKKYFEYILNNLREQDLEEVQAIWKDNWQDEVLKSIKGKKTLVLFSNENPIAMGGFVPVQDNEIKIAIVWLLCSKFVNNNKLLLYKVLQEEIQKAEKEYDLMFNYIYKSNFEAKKWLRGLGFKFDKPKPLGLKVKDGFEFFYKVKEGVKI